MCLTVSPLSGVARIHCFDVRWNVKITLMKYFLDLCMLLCTVFVFFELDSFWFVLHLLVSLFSVLDICLFCVYLHSISVGLPYTMSLGLSFVLFVIFLMRQRDICAVFSLLIPFLAKLPIL